MKKLIIFNIFFIMALACTYSVAAENPWAEKKKVVTRTYPLRGNQKVSITNSFGKVNVNNGNRSEVKVEITISVSARTDQAAQEILDRIQIDERNSSEISFETKFTNNPKGRNNNTKMEINYEVTLPAQTPLYIKNSFGNTVIPDRSGNTELQQSFGDLTTGNLSQLANVKVEFGKFAAEKVDGSRIKASYSDVNIKTLTGDLKTDFEFCKKLRLGLSNGLQSLTVKTSYSDLQITVPQNFNGNFQINTSFGKAQGGSFVRLTDQTKEKKYGPTFDRAYTGKTGNGKTNVFINASFGDVRFN